MLRLRLSERAVRSSWATCGVVDCNTGRLIDVFAYKADADRAKKFLELVGIGSYAKDLCGATIHDLAASTCEQVYNDRHYERLPEKDLAALAEALRCSL